MAVPEGRSHCGLAGGSNLMAKESCCEERVWWGGEEAGNFIGKRSPRRIPLRSAKTIGSRQSANRRWDDPSEVSARRRAKQ